MSMRHLGCCGVELGLSSLVRTVIKVGYVDLRRSRISARRDRGARMCVPATQAWPLLAKPTPMTVE